VPGDPTYHALQRAIAAGAIPFTCQGPDNGLTIEGGETLGYELADSARPLDRLFIQVGGGALASSVVQGLGDAHLLGAIEAVPKLHAVQTHGGYPLSRAFERVTSRGADAGEALEYARGHRSEFMWPWEEEPKSIATGILDDETYDWYAVVRGMIT